MRGLSPLEAHANGDSGRETLRQEARQAFLEPFQDLMGFVRATRESDAYPYFVPLGSAGENPVILVANDYLGLRGDPRIREAAKAAIDELGTSRCASPLAGGYTRLHQTLERRLAQFLDQEAATLFASGYQANVGIVSALMRPQDLIVTDVFNHASIVDGARLSGAEVRFLRHNSGKHLETILKGEPAGRRILVILEGIYSVDGDIVRLPELCRIAHDHGALVMIDEAHSLGVVGAGGRGAAEHFDMLREVDLVMGTMSKSLASVGGFVAGDEALVDVIRHQARSLIFSASAPPANIAAALAALDVLEKEPERRERLWRNTRRVLETLRANGFDTMRSETPVIPILVGEPSKTLEFAARLRDRGVLVCAAVPPMVQAHLSRVRAHVTAAHDEATLGRALATILEVGAALGIPKEHVAGDSIAAREDAAIPPIALDARPDRA